MSGRKRSFLGSVRQRIAPADTREAREIGVGRTDFQPMLDRKSGEMGVRDEIPLNPGKRE